ncbi:cell-wall agglutinin N-terminal ligand-sugar binding-domain-containing protein [Scheffersomyces xylosifermentans]|uniref:cell-wall agglutinin N-terminal ligand-sugar binding-domain-containing protein n=1 Tax=Scheffersomyces xylosifermentans TaxID=1304137 RepID=UPI00315DABC9
MKLHFLLVALFPFTIAKTLTSIFQTLEITNSSPQNRAQDIRTATLTWKIAKGDAIEGDVFFLDMPYVFRTKFQSSQVNLIADSKIYSTCDVYDGSYLESKSYLSCKTTNAVLGENFLSAEGTISFDFVFNAGGSSYISDLAGANHIVAGENAINWSGLQTTVNIDAGPFFAPVNEPNEIVYYTRSTPQGYEQIYFLAGKCQGGIVSGQIGIATDDTLDCSKFNVMATNQLNDFLLPKNYINIGSTVQCSSQSVAFSFNAVDSSYRVFLQGLETFPTDSNVVNHVFAYSLKCGDGTKISSRTNQGFVVIDGTFDSNGTDSQAVCVTETWTEKYKTTITIPCSKASCETTILVQVPNSELSSTATSITIESSESYISTAILPNTEISSIATSTTIASSEGSSSMTILPSSNCTTSTMDMETSVSSFSTSVSKDQSDSSEFSSLQRFSSVEATSVFPSSSFSSSDSQFTEPCSACEDSSVVPLSTTEFEDIEPSSVQSESSTVSITSISESFPSSDYSSSEVFLTYSNSSLEEISIDSSISEYKMLSSSSEETLSSLDSSSGESVSPPSTSTQETSEPPQNSESSSLESYSSEEEPTVSIIF